MEQAGAPPGLINVAQASRLQPTAAMAVLLLEADEEIRSPLFIFPQLDSEGNDMTR